MEVEATDDLCGECQTIDPVSALRHIDYAANSWEKASTLGEFFLDSENGCLFCNFCIQALNAARSARGRPLLSQAYLVKIDVNRRWGYTTDSESRDINWMTISIVDETVIGPEPGNSEGVYPDSIDIQLIKSPKGLVSDEDCYRSGRLVSDDVDLNLIKCWLSQCISHECETKTESSYCPEYLINTSTLKLAPQVGICQYAALSYVWGGPEIPQLTLKDMKTIAPDQDSWSIGQHWESVPQTIKDAILLCQLLSIDYLWVDSLCILHERPDQKAFGDTHLARQMCDVYESAHLTIVGAAAKDSWAGLPGLRAGTRNTKQHTLQLGDVLLAVVQRSPREALESSIWNTRAWTFQESILSNRLIIFTDEHCFWSCNVAESTFCEDIHREVVPEVDTSYDNDVLFFDVRETKQHLLSSSLGRYDHYTVYLEIMHDYSSRKLTYERDAEVAFGGVAHFLSKNISTEFLWCIPLRFFEQVLMFHPHEDFRGTLVRRRLFPSWSWVGWFLDKSEGRGFQCDSWVGTTRNFEYSLDQFRSINTWYRFTNTKAGGLGEFQALGGLENPFEGSPGPPLRTHALPQSIQHLHILLFDAMVAHLDLQKDDQNKQLARDLVSVRIPCTNRVLGTISLEVEKDEAQTYTFVSVAQETREVEVFRWNDPRPTEFKEVIHTILITTDEDGISERKQIFTLDKKDWDEAEPRQRTVLLV